MDKKTITISKEEYDRLVLADNFLNCLEACGADNWCGYGEAVDMLEEVDNE